MQHGLAPPEIREAEEAFQHYDIDKSGTIDRNELKPLLKFESHLTVLCNDQIH